MRLVGAMVIGSVVIIGFVLMGVIWTGYQAKRLASEKGRKEIRNELSEFSSFVVKDKDFHKELNREFRGTYIVIGLVVVALIGTALGLG
jgi:hypothetical protein